MIFRVGGVARRNHEGAMHATAGTWTDRAAKYQRRPLPFARSSAGGAGAVTGPGDMPVSEPLESVACPDLQAVVGHGF